MRDPLSLPARPFPPGAGRPAGSSPSHCFLPPVPPCIKELPWQREEMSSLLTAQARRLLGRAPLHEPGHLGPIHFLPR